MSIQRNKDLVRRYFEEAARNPELCDEIFAPSFLFHAIHHASTPTIQSNPQSEKAAYQWLNAVWGDWQMTIDEMIAESDHVLARWTFHGIQQGEYMGLLPTNKQVSYSGINIFRIEEGKIAEVWDLYDRLWLWQQLGVLPDLNEAIMRTGKSTDNP